MKIANLDAPDSSDSVSVVDFGATYAQIKRIRGCEGLTYEEFRSQLKPRFLRAWIQILVCYACLFSLMLLLSLTSAFSWQLQIVIGLAASIFVGLGVAFLNLWIHEAAHFNLHPSRSKNDFLTRIFLSSVIGNDIKSYRTVHMQHHKNLGKFEDPERSYYDRLDINFIISSLFGVRALKVFSLYKMSGSKAHKVRAKSRLMLIIAAVIHLAIIGAALAFSAYAAAIAWTVGVLAVFPFFGALRQLLEHRRADPQFLPGTKEHGAMNRTFGPGPLASILGGAGFNRHVIHHWDPNLSCTCFREAETFFRSSEIAALYESSRSTYASAFVDIVSNDHRLSRSGK